MIIQNKKTGEQQSVSPVEWKRIKDIGFGANWNVISQEDAPPKKVIPMEVLSFQNILKPIQKKEPKTNRDGSKGKRTVPGDKDV